MDILPGTGRLLFYYDFVPFTMLNLEVSSSPEGEKIGLNLMQKFINISIVTLVFRGFNRGKANIFWSFYCVKRKVFVKKVVRVETT